MSERATERDEALEWSRGYTNEGIAELLDDIAYHLVEHDQPILREAARRLRSPSDRGGDVFPGSCPKCGGKASDSGVGTYVCDDGCGWWIKHEDWSLTTHIRVSEPVLKAASTDARCDCASDEWCNVCLTPPWKEERNVEYHREDDGWTNEGLAKRLTLMADYGDHLTVGERNACAAAARRLRSPGDRGGEDG